MLLLKNWHSIMLLLKFFLGVQLININEVLHLHLKKESEICAPSIIKGL